jgi:hypothetical protein
MGSFFSIQRIQTVNEPYLPGFTHVEKRTKYRMRFKATLARESALNLADEKVNLLAGNCY